MSSCFGSSILCDDGGINDVNLCDIMKRQCYVLDSFCEIVIRINHVAANSGELWGAIFFEKAKSDKYLLLRVFTPKHTWKTQ